MHVREYPTRAEAQAGRLDGEVFVEVRGVDGRVRFGVLPATVEVDTPRGPVSQPIHEFLGSYWQTVEAMAAVNRAE